MKTMIALAILASMSVRQADDENFTFVVRAKSGFVQWKDTYQAFLAKLKKELPSATFKSKDRVPNDNAGWEDWKFSINNNRKLELVTFANVFGDIKVGQYFITIIGTVTYDATKKTIGMESGKSGMKFKLVNRLKRKDEKENPPDFVGDITAKVKDAKKDFNVSGQITLTDNSFVIWLESADVIEEKPK